MTIPVYPNFRPLELADKPEVDEALAAQPPVLSEYTFTNFYAWRGYYQFEISRRDGFLLLASRRGGERALFEPLGPGDHRPALTRLLAEGAERGLRLDGRTAAAFAGDPGFRVESERDHADYLYRLRDLIELKGNKYHAKRNLIHNFQRAHPGYEYVKLGPENLDECRNFETLWCQEKGCEEVVSLSVEQQATREMLDHFTDFGLAGGAIRADGAIRAAALGERLNPDTLVLHVLKADPGLTGLYQTLLHDFLEHEGGPYTHINLEQDLGIEGLRKAKLSYLPERLVEKFTLTRVNDPTSKSVR